MLLPRSSSHIQTSTFRKTGLYPGEPHVAHHPHPSLQKLTGLLISVMSRVLEASPVQQPLPELGCLSTPPALHGTYLIFSLDQEAQPSKLTPSLDMTSTHRRSYTMKGLVAWVRVAREVLVSLMPGTRPTP